METLRYDYKPKAWTMALAGLFFAGCGVVLGKTALDNDRGLILNGIVAFDSGDTTILYWVLTAVCVLFVLAAVFGMVRAFGVPGQIVLDMRALTAPKHAMSGTIVIVPLPTITDLRITQVRSEKFLAIHHTAGKLTISRSMLPSGDAFDALVHHLDARCRALRGR